MGRVYGFGASNSGYVLMNFLTNKHFGGTSTRTTEYGPFFIFFSYIVFGVIFYAKDDRILWKMGMPRFNDLTYISFVEIITRGLHSRCLLRLCTLQYSTQMKIVIG